MFCKKRFPKKFTKKCLFLILLKSFRPSGLQLYWRDTPALVFQNQPFVDLLQNRCSWIIHKIHRKTLTLELLFLITPCFTEYLQWLLLKVSGFQLATSLYKRLRQKCFNFAKFLRTFFLLTEHLWMTASCVYLWILSFSEHFFHRAPPENCYFVYKLKNFNHQLQ